MQKLIIGLTDANDGNNSCAFLIDIQSCSGSADQWAADIADAFVANPFPGLNWTTPVVSYITVTEDSHGVSPN